MGVSSSIPVLEETGPPPNFLESQEEDFIYGMAIIIWLAIAILLDLINGDFVLFILVLIPVAVFVSFILNKSCSYSATFPRVNSEFLYIILAVFLAWVIVAKDEKEKIIRILLVSLGVYIFSLVDLKICDRILFDATVIVPETIAVSLVLIAIYLYFISTYKGLAQPTINFI